MSRARVVVLLAVFMLIALPIVGGIQGNPPQGPAFVPGEVLLKFKSAAVASDRARLEAELGATQLHMFASNAEHWRLGPDVDVLQAIERLKSDPSVQYAEPNYILRADVTPNDPRYPELWGMNNTGQTGGTADADIDADTAWNVSTGSSNVLVAVIDTGIDYNHPDLAANIWTNPGEIPGNGIDDDGNGFIDDIHGWDFVNNDGDPFDDYGHGTHCSGTIGGVGNNGIGVTGVNWNVSIMGVKFLNSSGSGTTANAILAVQYTTMMHVNLTSNSWGGGSFSQALYDAIAAAGAANIAFVAAAGNNGANSDTSPAYPAAYDLPNIISVAATDDNDQLASFSNYGAVSVDLAAPGVDVLSTLPGNQYGLNSGTSMATPHVSGAYALALSVSAPGIPVAQVKNILLSSVDHIPAMAGKCVSNGRLNIFFAIAEPDTTNPGMIDDLATIDPTSNTMGLTWTATGDDGAVGTANSYEVRYSTSVIDESNWASATRAGNEPTPGPAGTAEAMEVRNLMASTPYFFAVKAFDEWGNPGPVSNIATGTTLPPPTGQVAPTSVSDDLYTGQQSDHVVMLSNIGEGTLDFDIPAPSLGEPMAVQPFLDLGKDELDPRHGDPVVAGAGGPDTFGYRWTDSDEPGGPAFNWVDISGTGTQITLTGDDATSAPIALGFNMPLYGTLFDSIRVCTNGWLSFTSTSTAYSNQPLPNSGAPENLVAPFWDDLTMAASGQAFFQNFGNSAIVQWNAVPHYSAGGPYTFQAILDASGTITFQYLSMGTPLDSGTIGIQNATKTDGLTVAFNQAYMHDGLAVRIASIPQWLTAFPTSGRIAAGGSKAINLHMDASGLEGGTYPGVVHILTNDPANPDLIVNAALHVIGAPDASVQPASLAYGVSFLGQPYTQNLIVANNGTDTLHVSGISSSHPGELTAVPSAFNIAPHGSQNVVVTWTPAILGPFSGSLTVASDDAGEPIITVPVTGESVPSPVMIVNPTSFSETLFSGNQVSRTLTVTNTGGPDLVVDAAVDLGGGQLVYTDDVGVNGAGGPDGFGYRWKDSDASGGPTFNWVDISSTGTLLSLTGDDASATISNMGMTFPFYGTNYTGIRVCTNGWISFTTSSTSNQYSNTALPTAVSTTTLPPNSIAAMWEDLYFRTANATYPRTTQAFWQYDGSRVIIQYKHAYNRGSTEDLNFEILLYPNGKIVMQYETMVGTLNGSTVGIQNLQATTPTNFLQMAFNSAYLKSNLAIQISRQPDWLGVTPSHAVIPPNQSANFNVTFDSSERLGGTLNGAVVLHTNVPGQATEQVPATLHVVGAPIASIVPTSFAYGTRYTGFSHLTTFQVVNTGTDVLNVSDVYSDDPSLSVLESASEGGEQTPAAAFPLPPGSARLFNLRWAPTVAGNLNALVHVISDDPVNGDRQMPVTGTAILPPVTAWSPASFNEFANVGDVLHRTLHLENNGGSDLNFISQIGLNSGASVAVDHSPELKKDEPDTRPGVLGAGGPDVFGYTWRDSDQPGGPAFSWFDISGIGTTIPFATADDSNYGPIDIGFPFPFYGQTFSTVRAGTNGFLSFTDTGTYLTNYPLPSTSSAANMLAVFNDDLHQRNGNAKYYSDGNRFIVQYTDWDQYSPSGEHYNFQVILYRNGRIVYQYLTMTTNDLAGATIGIQNATKDDGLTVDYNAPYVHDALAVEFRPPAGWLVVSPDAGTIPPGGSLDIDVAFDATQLLGGDYSANIDLSTNDPANGQIRVPAMLHVTGIPDIDALPASLTFPTTYVGYTRDLTTSVRNVGTDVLQVTGVSVSGDFSQAGLTPPVAIPPGGAIPVTVTFAPASAGPLTGELTITSADPDEPTITVPLSGDAIVSPEMHVSPSSLSAFLPPSSTTTRTVQVCNTGGSDLNWSSGTNIVSGVSVTQYTGLALGKDEIDPSPGILGAGGPDAFGYSWVDSDEAGGPAFDWVDITGVGTPITALDADDEVVTGIPIGFTFPFYGNPFSTLSVSSNGWLSFTYTGTTSYLTNYPLPNTSGVDNMLAGFWDDLSFSATHGSGQAFYYNDGTRFILSFVNVPHYPSTGTGPYTFQYILYPNGKIVYQYLSVGPTQNSATIGIQNAAKDDGLTVVYNADYVHDGLAVAIQAIPRWATMSPESGVLAAGACEDVTVTIDSTDLAHGVHESVLNFAAENDPYLATASVPTTLTVNYKPVADAGTPQSLECTGSDGASAMLDGTASSDQDLDPLTWSWTAPGATLDDATSATPTGFFPLGTTTASLVVNDGYEDSDPDTVDVTVADTLPPTIVCPTSATVECQSNLQAIVTIAPAVGGDVCGGVTITNTHNAGGADASGSYPLGTTNVTFTAVDGSGHTASCMMSVTVVDTTAPALSVTPDPSVLWPPNHRMVDVAYNVVAIDACDPNPAVVLVSVTSNEPDDAQGGGDGQTTNDIQGAGTGTNDRLVQLRAEREGHGTGRVYTATYRVTDSSGNATSASAAVRAPHDLGSVVEPIALSVNGKTSTTVTWPSVPGAVSYDVIRGNLSALRINGSNVELSQVTCIETGSIDATTSGHEDAAVPAPGQVFYYAVQFFDGEQDSSYGSESAGRARVVTSGNCP